MEETFGQLVYRLREHVQHWTQKELARRTGLDQSTISAVERDQGTPRSTTVTQLARALRFEATPWLVHFGHLPPSPEGEAAPAPVATVARDSDRMSVAAIVAAVEAHPGEEFQRRLGIKRRTLPRPNYESFCVDLYRMWEGNAMMVFNLYGGDEGAAPGGIAQK